MGSRTRLTLLSFFVLPYYFSFCVKRRGPFLAVRDGICGCLRPIAVSLMECLT
jgi:hypothetical protein